jgi:copper chaperone CopZ
MRLSHVALACAFLFSGVALAKDTTAVLGVVGWHCEGCSERTVAAVKKVKGVKDASADVQAKRLVVTYDDSQVKQGDIEKTVTALHYKIAQAK